MELQNIRFKDWSLSLREPGAVVEGLEDIAQCIAVIVVTQKGSDPFRPDFGVDLFKWIDSPVNVAGPNLVVEILETIRKWEPRVTVERIEYRVEDARLYFSIIWAFNGTQGETTLLREGDAFVIPTLEPPVRQFVADPTFSPASGTFAGFGEISIACETEDAIIYYTTDGSLPTGSSPVYTGPFIINADTIVRARAFASGFIPSNVVSDSFAVVPYEATILTTPGTYDAQVTVEIVANDPDVVIHYTLDGTEPTALSPIFSGSLLLVESATVKAKAIRAPGLSAPADSVTYTIRSLAPSVSPTSGTFETSRIVAITNPNPAGEIYYTLDGSTPTSSSFLYTGPFTITENAEIRARVISPLNIPSTTASASISIQVSSVVVTPATGEYLNTVTVTASTATPGAEIRYTTDGTTPTTSSALYTGPLVFTQTSLFRARAFKTNCLPSAIASADYSVRRPVWIAVTETTAPVISIDEGLSWQTKTTPFGSGQGLSRNFFNIMGVGGVPLLGVRNSFTPRRSLNLGDTWSQIANWVATAEWFWARGNDILLVRTSPPAGTSALFLSTDGGATINPITVDGILANANFRGFCKAGSRIFVAINIAGSTRHYVSNNNGANWTLVLNSSFRTSPTRGYMSPDGSFIFLLLAGGYSWSTNGGVSFSQGSFNTPSIPAWYAFPANLPLTSYHIHTASLTNQTSVRRSTNGDVLSSTQIALISGFVASYIACSPDGTKLLMSGQGRTFYSSNSGSNWTEITSNLPTILTTNAYSFQMLL